jgi:hypothetical protein
MKHLAPVAAVVLSAACGFAPTGDPVSLAERLSDRAYLEVDPTSQVDATAIASGRALSVAPAIVDGALVVRTTDDGYLLVEDMTLPLTDVTVPSGMFGPAPVRFTDLTVSLGTQLAVPLPADSGAALAGSGRADLILDWAMVDRSGRIIPLGMRRAPRAQFTVAIHEGKGGTLHAELATQLDGVAIAIIDGAALTDVALAIRGDAR